MNQEHSDILLSEPWMVEYANKLSAMDNEDLFYEMLDANVPDDYDGAFTDEGDWMSQYASVTYARRMGYEVIRENWSLFNHLFEGDQHDEV